GTAGAQDAARARLRAFVAFETAADEAEYDRRLDAYEAAVLRVAATEVAADAFGWGGPDHQGAWDAAADRLRDLADEVESTDPLPPAPAAGSARADILAGLHAAEATTIGDETPEALLARHDAAVRTEVLDAVVTWLEGRARAYRSTGGSRDREAHAIRTMADKIRQGAIAGGDAA
ncbi:hypothetical protein, partial [Streptomyces youssoufiensis]